MDDFPDKLYSLYIHQPLSDLPDRHLNNIKNNLKKMKDLIGRRVTSQLEQYYTIARWINEHVRTMKLNMERDISKTT